jgi:hypothetical protein
MDDGILTELSDSRLTVLTPVAALAEVDKLWKNTMV